MMTINKLKTIAASQQTMNHEAVRSHRMRINDRIDDNLKVSVISPTYNRIEYVLNSIEEATGKYVTVLDDDDV